MSDRENRTSLLRPWLAKHRGISKDRIETYLKIFKAHTNPTNKNTKTHKPNNKEKTTHNTITMSENLFTTWDTKIHADEFNISN